MHQRAILEKYAEDNCFPNIRVFVDDGYSGVSFGRHCFQEMYELIEAGKVRIVIMKDLSRLGRKYIEVGNYKRKIYVLKKEQLRFENTHHRQDRCSQAGEKAKPDLTAADRHLLPLHRTLYSAERNYLSRRKNA